MPEEEFEKLLRDLEERYARYRDRMNNFPAGSPIFMKYQNLAHAAWQSLAELERPYGYDRAEEERDWEKISAVKEPDVPTVSWLEYHDQLLAQDTELLTKIVDKLMSPEIAAYETHVAKRAATSSPLQKRALAYISAVWLAVSVAQFAIGAATAGFIWLVAAAVVLITALVTD